MRLTCDVDVVNRLLPSHNVRKNSKATRTQISIGRKPGNGVMKHGTLYMMLCTAKDMNGRKYLLKGNVEQVFTKFVSEGKATIRMKHPEEDICLCKADVIQLRAFLNVLRLAVQGKSLDNMTLCSLAPASAKSMERPKTSLVIESRREYPLTTNFPSSLQTLQVCHCRMKRIDSRIFSLKHLTALDLSHNLLESVPDDLAKLTNLAELRLAHNNLTELSPNVCLQQSLQNSLTVLNLNSNCIKQLPLQICELVNLLRLDVSKNGMLRLPPTIGRLGKLTELIASDNKLTTIPSSFMRLRLDNVDLSQNEFDLSQDAEVLERNVGVPSLMEWAARAARKYRLPYSEEDLHRHLCHYLNSARQCWCGSYCFQSSARYITKIELRRVAGSITFVTTTGGTSVPIEGFLCSYKCLGKFEKNPRAYWR